MRSKRNGIDGNELGKEEQILEFKQKLSKPSTQEGQGPLRYIIGTRTAWKDKNRSLTPTLELMAKMKKTERIFPP